MCSVKWNKAHVRSVAKYKCSVVEGVRGAG